ncbi:MAG: T9SS type A sorting domain-containing protein [Luteibaculaceae bacterium]
MKKNLLLFFACLFLGITNLMAVNVTFRVNMSETTVRPGGVHVAGSFQGWNASGTPLTNTGNGIFEVTVDIPAGTAIQYKFINGNSWNAPDINENLLAAGCGTAPDGNRTLTVPDTDIILPAVCFNSCVECGTTTPTVNVTFRVDMSEQTVSPNGVHLAGIFQGWNPSATPMLDQNGDGIYEATVSMAPGISVEYKFINGNGWNAPNVPENLNPAGCGTGPDGNRTLTVPADDATLPAFCFNNCVECEPIIPPNPVAVTFRVNMAEQTVSPDGVHIAGSFNNFTPALMSLEANNVYSFTIDILEGTTVIYKFLNGPTFANEEIVPQACGVANNFGSFDRTFLIPFEETELDIPTVCFGACTNCVVLGDPVPVTFRVNMSNQTVAPGGPRIAGSWNNFALATMAAEGNATFAITVDIPVGSIVTYKFINGNSFDFEETVPAACGQANPFGSFDRVFTIPDEPAVTVPTVCFGSCEDCPEPGPTVLVFFRVDMQNQTVAPGGPRFVGSINNFTPEAMLVESGTIFSFSAMVEVGSTVTYRFLNGATFNQSETVPADCGVPDGFGNFNRTFEVTDEPVIFIDVVCFSSCAACPILPDPVSVTFVVDMDNVAEINPEGVFIAGSFTSPAWSVQAMTNIGNNQFSFTANILPGTTVQFKYLNGPTFDFQETVPADCGTPDGFGGFNRTLVVGDTNQNIPPVCFGECVGNCTVSILENSKIGKLGIFPNPSNGMVRITTNNLVLNQENNITIFDNTGRIIFQTKLRASDQMLNISHLKSGLYHIVLDNAEGRFTSKLIKN